MTAYRRLSLRSSAAAIARWNTSILWRSRNGIINRHVIVLLYPMGGGRSQFIRLPADSAFTRGSGSSIWSEDLHTTRWFSRGYQRTRISTLPSDPSFVLCNDFSVLTSKRSETSKINRTIYERWGLVVRGHVIVIRHAKNNCMRVTNVRHEERCLIDLLLKSHLLRIKAADERKSSTDDRESSADNPESE